MAYNKEQLLKLGVHEKLELVYDLWDSIDEELLPVSEELQQIIRERYQDYIDNPRDVISIDELKKMIWEKYGF